MNVYKILNKIDELPNTNEKWLVHTDHLKMISNEVRDLKINNLKLKQEIEELKKQIRVLKAERNNAIGKLAEKAYREFIIEEE